MLFRSQRPSASVTEFDSGTETSLGSRAASAGPGANVPVTPALSNPLPPQNVLQPLNTPRPPAGSAGLPNSGATAAPLGIQGVVNTPPQTSTAFGNPAPGAPVGGAALGWQGPTQLKVGDSFAVQLTMQADQPVVSIPMAVGFDPRMLQVVSVTEGDFLKQGGAQTSFTSRVDPNGQILMTGTRAGDSGATALGSVATVNLRVVAAPTPETRLQLLTISPIVLGGRGISAPLPLPHTISVSP